MGRSAPIHVFADITSSGDEEIIALKSGVTFRIIAILATNIGASDINFKLTSNTSARTGTHALVSKGGINPKFNQEFDEFFCEGTVSQNIAGNLSASGTVGVDILYVEVT